METYRLIHTCECGMVSEASGPVPGDVTWRCERCSTLHLVRFRRQPVDE